MLKSINQVIVFVMELIMISSFAYYGYQKSAATFNRYILAILFAIVAMVLWAIFAAPKSSHRLPMPYLALFRAVMFLFTAFLVYNSGQKCLAIIIVFFAIVTQILSYGYES